MNDEFTEPGKLLAVPREGKAVTTWPNQAEAWTDVARQIRKAVEEMGRGESKATKPTGGGFDAGWGIAQPASNVSQPAALGAGTGLGQPVHERPRSSNLRLKKEFTDFDRDKFLHDTFDYMAKFFDASLEELAARNQGIQVRFQRLDAQRFSAVAYREGKTVAECSVRVGGLGGKSPSLSFSFSANAPVGTSNEIVTIESDTQAMYFKSIGLQSHRGQGNSQLSEQGVSEYFWDLFIEPLQR